MMCGRPQGFLAVAVLNVVEKLQQFRPVRFPTIEFSAVQKSRIINSLFVVLFLSISIQAHAEFATLDEFKKLGEKFDHLTTGFALTGEHSALDCGECHIGGVFEALPRQCEACHDNVIGEGKPANHIETNSPCDTCHTTQGFIATAVMDHSIINGSCGSCHDGISATGKGPTHITTTNICEACHTFNFWTPALEVDHDQVLGSCGGCHNGIAATGKTPNHVLTTDNCEGCHFASGESWVPIITVDHAFVLGTCSSCHNGTIAIGKGPNHIDTVLECDACHIPGDPSWSAAGIDHDEFVATGRACAESGCHDGVGATGKPNDHIASSNLCETCHSAGAAWIPVLRVDHNEVQGSCATANCHDNDKPNDQLHANVSNECGACHDAGNAWDPAIRTDHAEVILPCQSCHDGTVAPGKHPAHIVTTEDCGACHSTVTFVGAFDHSAVIGQRCADAGCHDNRKPPPPDHPNTSNECQACHQAGVAWSSVLQVDHNEVIGNCSSCHNKPNNHINTSNVCEACHRPAPNQWTDIAGVDHDQVLGDCSACHTKDNGHIDSSNVCDACHSTVSFDPAIRVDHNHVNGSCGNCHNGTTAIGQNNGHINTSTACEACHSSDRWIPVIRVDHDQIVGVDQCSTCHTKSGDHPITGNECGACHRSRNNWSNNITVPHNNTNTPPGSCSSCHNGNIAEGKERDHCPTNLECDVCHRTNDWDNTIRDC